MKPPNKPPKNHSKLWTLMVCIAILLIGIEGGYEAGKSLPAPSATPSTVTGLNRPAVTPTELGWYRNQSIVYDNYGLNSNITAPILAFFEAASPNTSVAGQRNVIDSLPGQPSYSDFWLVYKVLVPAGYVANTIRSFEAAVVSQYLIEATNLIVNCPVENPGATVQNSSAALEAGWYRGQTVYYFNAGTNTTGWGAVIQTAPIYTFAYPNGTPVAGQHNIVNVYPGNPGYSDDWSIITVAVNSSYPANSVRSVGEILAEVRGGEFSLQATRLFVDCPIVT
ncbi:MAG: hypothetical protein WAN40_01500 [Thermoplasmata archaeon]